MVTLGTYIKYAATVLNIKKPLDGSIHFYVVLFALLDRANLERGKFCYKTEL